MCMWTSRYQSVTDGSRGVARLLYTRKVPPADSLHYYHAAAQGQHVSEMTYFVSGGT